jgi:hypothetical protein
MVELGGSGSLRERAGELLALALGPYDPLANDAGLVARARRDVVPVPLPKLTDTQKKLPTSRKAGRRQEA